MENPSQLQADTFQQFDPARVPSPCYVVDEVAIERNLQVLAQVQADSGAHILLALKAFSMFSLAPLIMQYLRGTCSSGLHEALLAHEFYGGGLRDNAKREVHVFSPGFTAPDFSQLLGICDHFVFNSLSQWQRFRPDFLRARARQPGLAAGLRINPGVSQGTTELYDPCARGSRLGVPIEQVLAASSAELDGLSGVHFHALCEQGFGPLANVLDAVENQLGPVLAQLDWLNCGGGHLITQPGYDTAGLVARVQQLRQRYGVDVYLEPGEAIAIRSGVLVSEVLDLPQSGQPLAILDTSATCHMPDTLEMPYRANVFDADGLAAGVAGEKAHTYRLGGQTCLAGDVMGDYSFEQPLVVGQRLMFDDMAHYTMVKTTTFNGIGLPALAIWNSKTDALRVVRQFGYEDFRARLS